MLAIHLLMLSLSTVACFVGRSSAGISGHWAQFYTDNNYTTEIARTININKSGCLTGPSESFKIIRTTNWAIDDATYSLIASLQGDCFCQTNCWEFHPYLVLSDRKEDGDNRVRHIHPAPPR